MGLFGRIGRVIRANISGLVGDAEDPEKILEQAVADMNGDLIQIRQAVAQAIATQKRTERQCAQAESTAQEWYRRAQLAMQKGDEALAREALERRQSYASTAEAMNAQIQQQRTVVTQLKQNMRSLENKLAEAKSKKDLYVARARSAKASQQLGDMLNSANPGSSMAAFERMEEKVMQLEAQAQVANELGQDDVERRFAELEAGGDIDAQLAAMKADSLPAAQSSAALPGEANIDAELEEIRAQIRDHS